MSLPATWVLLRGLTREARHWGDFNNLLEQQLNQIDPDARHTVLALDLPGNGTLSLSNSPTSVHGMMLAARQQLLVLGIKPPYTLVAMSLGGMVATDWAQQFPAEVARMTLVNTSLRPYSSLTQRLRPGSWWPLLRLAARWRNPPAAEAIVHRLTCNREASRCDDLKRWVTLRQSAPVSAGNALRQLLAAARFRSAAQPPLCPVLVLSSKADALVDDRCSAALAAAWLAPHYRHPWAGHDLPHDDSPWVAQRIAGWWSKK